MSGRQGKKIARWAENLIFPGILCLLPFLKIRQGIELTDSFYGLINFRFFPTAGREWTVATWLANLLGWALMRLPFGQTLIGIRFYCGLLIVAMTLWGYFSLKRELSAALTFWGEALAVCLCWIPVTSLYNYLTFFLFLAGSLLLYEGLSRGRRPLLFLAGVCLGANVLTRLPNFLECILILAVFYDAWLKKEKLKTLWGNVFVCVGGYLTALAAGLFLLGLQFGPSAYLRMLQGLSGYSATDASYSPFSMVSSIFASYGYSLPWLFLILAGAAGGCILYAVFPGRFLRCKDFLYGAGLLLLLRLLWGRGMFVFQYASDRSVYYWFTVFLDLALALCVRTLAAGRKESAPPGEGVACGDEKIVHGEGVACGDESIAHGEEVALGGEEGAARREIREKLLALLAVLVILVTPVGSNNGLYPLMNNLFLVAPVALWLGGKLWARIVSASRRTSVCSRPLRIWMAAFALALTVQTAGFGLRYVFRDSADGQPRNVRVSGAAVLEGVFTNAENAAALQDVIDFYNTDMREEDSLLAFGDVPGWCWVLDLHPALCHDWPDLDTFPVARMGTDL